MAICTRPWDPEELGARDYGKLPGAGDSFTEALRVGRSWGILSGISGRLPGLLPLTKAPWLS